MPEFDAAYDAEMFTAGAEFWGYPCPRMEKEQPEKRVHRLGMERINWNMGKARLSYSSWPRLQA